ncbi:MAG: hypothetical protein RIS44_2267 [Pseudomonadota bacterium]|jgi:type I restriction enzyme S subunit
MSKWKTSPLSSVCTVFGDGDWIESKDQSPTGVRLIQTGNVGEGEFKDRAEKARFISRETFARLRCTEIFAGDCLISRLPDPAGRACMVPETGERMITAVDCTIVRFDQIKLLPEFFVYYSQTGDYLSAVEREATGTTRKRISRARLGQIQVPLAPMFEQRRIVAILDEAFEGIATAKANAEKNRQNARALFDSHLQTVFSQRGEGWVEKPLCEVASILNGYAFKSGDFSSRGPTKSIKITNVGVREFVETCDSGLPADFSQQFASVAAPAGSLVIALTRTIIADGLKVGIVPPSYDCALVNQRVAALLPKSEKASASYLFAYLSTSIVMNYVKDRVNTLMQPNLSINDLRAMPIPLPPESERENIIEKLLAIEAETQNLEAIYQRKLEALDELKRSLLHQAFSGKL